MEESLMLENISKKDLDDLLRKFLVSKGVPIAGDSCESNRRTPGEEVSLTFPTEERGVYIAITLQKVAT